MQQMVSLLQILLLAQHVSGTIMPPGVYPLAVNKHYYYYYYYYHQELKSIIQVVAACGIWCCKDGRYNI